MSLHWGSFGWRRVLPQCWQLWLIRVVVAIVGWLWQFLKNKNGESYPHGLTLSFIEHLEATIGLSTALSSILCPMNREPEERETGSDGWWRVQAHRMFISHVHHLTRARCLLHQDNNNMPMKGHCPQITKTTNRGKVWNTVKHPTETWRCKVRKCCLKTGIDGLAWFSIVTNPQFVKIT